MKIIIFYLSIIYITWIMYIFGMGIKKQWKAGELELQTKIIAFPGVVIFILLDVFLQVCMTIPFMDKPQDWMFTSRMNRYLRTQRNTWRGIVADWMCRIMLNPFDPKGRHCVDK